MRVLVAEDNAQWRSIIAGVLNAGHVDYVERGDRILEAAEKLHPELITLDVSMPGQSGLNVLPRLRTLLPHAIIVIVSATATPLYREEAFARGANGYVEKTRVHSDLLRTIASAREHGGRLGERVSERLQRAPSIVATTTPLNSSALF